jgi:hypothetical protein
METLTNWWRSVTGTAAPAEQQPLVQNPSGMSDGVMGGRKRKSKKTRRGGKKSRKSKPSRK